MWQSPAWDHRAFNRTPLRRFPEAEPPVEVRHAAGTSVREHAIEVERDAAEFDAQPAVLGVDHGVLGPGDLPVPFEEGVIRADAGQADAARIDEHRLAVAAQQLPMGVPAS